MRCIQTGFSPPERVETVCEAEVSWLVRRDREQVCFASFQHLRNILDLFGQGI